MDSHYAGSGAVSLAFPTPVLQKQLTDTAATNAALHQLVLEREKETTDGGGNHYWHSGGDLFEWPGQAIATFRDYVAQGISEISQFCLARQIDRPVDIQMDGEAWAILCRNGGYGKIRNHPEWDWSGVYCVSLGVPDPGAPRDGGKIECLDPRTGVTDISLDGKNALPPMVIDPQPGLMVVFPGWLYHYVNPFHGQGECVSIGFNIRLNADG